MTETLKRNMGLSLAVAVGFIIGGLGLTLAITAALPAHVEAQASPSTATKFHAGGCSVDESKFNRLVTLTTRIGRTSGRYNTLESPADTPFQVPVGQELIICEVRMTLYSAPRVPGLTVAEGSLLVGYSDSPMLDTIGGIGIENIGVLYLPKVREEFVTIDTLFKSVPEGEYPFLRADPGRQWAAVAVGYLADAP